MKMWCCFDGGREGNVMSFFFSFFFIFSKIRSSVFSVVTSSLTKKKTKTKKKMIFNLEGLTVYFPYEYLYPVRFKRVDFFTIAILLPFSSSRFSLFPIAHDSDDDASSSSHHHHHHLRQFTHNNSHHHNNRNNTNT